MKTQKRYHMSGPPIRIQQIALNPRKTREERSTIREYIAANKNMREETRDWLTLTAR